MSDSEMRLPETDSTEGANVSHQETPLCAERSAVDASQAQDHTEPSAKSTEDEATAVPQEQHSAHEESANPSAEIVQQEQQEAGVDGLPSETKPDAMDGEEASTAPSNEQPSDGAPGSAGASTPEMVDLDKKLEPDGDTPARPSSSPEPSS